MRPQYILLLLRRHLLNFHHPHHHSLCSLQHRNMYIHRIIIFLDRFRTLTVPMRARNFLPSLVLFPLDWLGVQNLSQDEQNWVLSVIIYLRSCLEIIFKALVSYFCLLDSNHFTIHCCQIYWTHQLSYSLPFSSHHKDAIIPFSLFYFVSVDFVKFPTFNIGCLNSYSCL